MLKKKWERIVSKSKPEGVSAAGSKDGGGGGESVRTALKEVGRLLVGGGFGYMDETTPASPSFRKSPSPSSPPMPLTANPVATSSYNVFSAEPSRSSADAVRRSGSFKGSSKEKASSRTMMQASPPPTSVSSPTSTSMTMSGTSSTRDSLSSVSTNVSLTVGDVTPNDKTAASWPAAAAASQPPASALDDLARSTKPWIPLPNGLNKTWEHLQKTPTCVTLLLIRISCSIAKTCSSPEP